MPSITYPVNFLIAAVFSLPQPNRVPFCADLSPIGRRPIGPVSEPLRTRNGSAGLILYPRVAGAEPAWRVRSPAGGLPGGGCSHFVRKRHGYVAAMRYSRKKRHRWTGRAMLR